MEQKVVPLNETVGSKVKYRSYIKELKAELRKVTWTSKDELVVCTKIVLGGTFAFGLGIYVVDLIVKGSLDGLHMLVQRIIG